MSDSTPSPAGWPARVRSQLEQFTIDADEHLDTARRRFESRFRLNRPRHIAAYRGFGDARGIDLIGRVLADRPQGGPQDDDHWWDNLLNTYRRFESDEVPGTPLQLRFGSRQAEVVTDHEGYYAGTLDPAAPLGPALWENATVALADGSLSTPQPVLQVSAQARLGIISDIDDTILHSGVTHWKTAAQLTFLHNARTRKPLKGVAKLYQALQADAVGHARAPIFYVSSSPWNLYDLLEDFMELNAIPPGPMFLRDLGLDILKLIKTPGHGHKLERARLLIERFPHLRWVLIGDSGQADAALYADAAQAFGDRIAAIYIRDVDPDADSALDKSVDGFIERVVGTSVPMLRARDSLAMAEHAAQLGLIAAGALSSIAKEVARDQQRPSLAEAAVEGAVQGQADSPTPVKDEATARKSQ